MALVGCIALSITDTYNINITIPLVTGEFCRTTFIHVELVEYLIDSDLTYCNTFEN